MVIEKKEHLIKELKDASKGADTVYLAPDPDREGEFIAWSLKKMLGLKKPRRAVFNEITKRAVQDAIAHPREIDENLFNAQQARRVLDRLVGYKISPLLWRRVQSGTSAGRVQSVALRLICDREAEIRAFVPEEYWSITATLSKPSRSRPSMRAADRAPGRAEAPKRCRRRPTRRRKPQTGSGAGAKSAQSRQKRQAAQVQHRLRGGGEGASAPSCRARRYTVLARASRRDVRRQPFLPYTTSTMQQDASVRLRFKPKRTMSLAQQLYEGIELGDAGHQGLITYMRTDSTRISAEAQVTVKQLHRRSSSAGLRRRGPHRPRPRPTCRTRMRRSARPTSRSRRIASSRTSRRISSSFIN